MTDPELIATAGAALYGPRFHSELARALGVSRRAVHRWCDGEDRPKREVWRSIEALVKARQEELRAVARAIA